MTTEKKAGASPSPRQQTLMALDQIWDVLQESWKVYLFQNEGDDTKPLPPENRGSWFCPVVSKIDAEMARRIAIQEKLNIIYDMGAGDLRFSYWMAEQGFKVVAYESMPDHPRRAISVLGIPTFELHIQDYLEPFLEILASDEEGQLFCFFGGTNKPPLIPLLGHVIEGYWEIGTKYWKDGKVVKQW